MTVYVEDGSGYAFQFPVKEQLDKLISFVSDYVKCPYEPEVSVSIVTKESIHELNQQFRGVDRPTDVLSFPMMEYSSPEDFEGEAFLSSLTVSPDTGELILGDIVLCAQVIHEQAEEYGHSEQREFSFLVVHSMLHLFGHDHIGAEERAVMEEKQRNILELLQIYR